MISLSTAYDRMLAGVWAWSSTDDVEDGMDAFSTCAYMSALEVSNFVSVWILFEAISGKQVGMSKSIIAAIACLIFVANALYIRSRSAEISLIVHCPATARCASRTAARYLTASTAVFIGSFYLLYLATN